MIPKRSAPVVTGHELFKRRQRQLDREYAQRSPGAPRPPQSPDPSAVSAATYDEDIDRRFALGHTVAQVAREYSVTRQFLWSHHSPAIRAMIRVRRMPDRAILAAPAAPLGRPRAARQGKVGPTPQ